MRTTIHPTGMFGAVTAVATVALLAGLTACASNSTPAAGGSSTAASSSAGESSAATAASGAVTSGAAQLDGITFVATEVTGAYTIVSGSTITLTFDAAGTLSARAGCNNLFGGFTITGDVLSAPQLASTMMACEESLMAQDTWLSGFLASSPTWTFIDGTLTLTNGTDTLVMTAAPSGAAALEATGWKLVGLISNTASANSVSAVDPTLSAWLRFTTGEVAFNNSCNTGGGTVEIADSTITFGPLRSTLILCDGASGETEAAMSAVLQGTTPYRVTADPSGAVLTITSADGTSGLQLAADPSLGADAFATATPSSGG